MAQAATMMPRAAWALAALALAPLALGLAAPLCAWGVCALASPAAWQGLREWTALRGRLTGLSLVAGAAAAAGGHPALAAAALAVAGAAGAGGSLCLAAAVAAGLGAAVWVLRGPAAAAAVLALACGACALLRASERVTDGALALAARRGVAASGKDALRVAAAIDGVVLALPASRAPETRRWGARARTAPPPRARPLASVRASGNPAALPLLAAGLRALGCEVWGRGSRVVPMRHATDAHAFAVADMLARGRRVAVVTGPGPGSLAADLIVQAGGVPAAVAEPGVVLLGPRLDQLTDFLRLARRARRSSRLLGLAAALLGGPGTAWAALGRLGPATAAWAAIATLLLLAGIGAANAATRIFTSSQRRYG